jgi:hypothetical protein
MRATAKKNWIEVDLAEKLGGMSASRAVNYLNYSFDNGLEEILMNGTRTTPIALMGELPGLHSVPASEVAPIAFWGGPPGKRGWFDGSLLTLLIDRIMIAADDGNERLLARFLNLNV